ncbi:hypothetical protein ISS05_03580 [Candidatus Woesearchaeota archaeon]|nr:hypothetical protein [Candidatus Woesearchaeota archaeon]
MNVEIANRITDSLEEKTVLLNLANRDSITLNGLLNNASDYMLMGEHEKALQIFKKVINLNPFHPDAYDGVFDCIRGLWNLAKDKRTKTDLIVEMGLTMDKGTQYGIYADIDYKGVYQ